jgi:DNA-binding transcriptional LysR family regulator
LLAQPSGVLSTSLPVDFAAIYLAPLIAEFAGLYSGIPFNFGMRPRQVGLACKPFAVGSRMVEPESAQCILRTLALLTPYLYASLGYLERSGEPSKPTDLARHVCLNILKAGSWRLHDGKRTTAVAVGGSFALIQHEG